MTDNERKIGIRMAHELKEKVMNYMDNHGYKHVQVFPAVVIDKDLFGVRLTSLDLKNDYKQRVLDIMEREFSDVLKLYRTTSTTATFIIKGVCS